MPTVALHTLGCKLNAAETSMIGRQFIERGFEVVDFGEPADVYVVNTCSVTERADRECRQLIRRALRSSAHPFIVVTGCYAQLAPEQIASIDGVDVVLGTREKFHLFEYVTAFRKNEIPRVHVSDVATVDEFGPAFSTGIGGRTRAFLKIQDGCDYNCSFCTIPRARGASRSQNPDDTLRQAQMLVEQGYREIVLTGVNVGDYGRKSGTNLLMLLEKLTALRGLDRLRISSIEPNLLNREIIDFVASNDMMCKHFHIPLQSGSDDILRRMRRRYTSGQYRNLIHTITQHIPECGIGVDVIVGFPGETETHFDDTHRFLADLPVSYLHVFTYSERSDTPAATFGNVVEPAARSRRNHKLRVLGLMKRHEFATRWLGATVPVLLEGDVEAGLRFGFTSNYLRVAVPAGSAVENTIVPVRVDSVDGDGIAHGKPVCEAPRRVAV